MAIRNLLILFATFSKAAKIIKNRKFSYHGFWLQVSVSDSVEMKKAGISDHRIWLQVSVMLWKWKKQELSWSHILVASFSDGVEMKKAGIFLITDFGCKFYASSDKKDVSYVGDPNKPIHANFAR